VAVPGHGGGHETVELIAAAVLVIGGTIFTLRALRTRPAPGPVASADPAGRPTAVDPSAEPAAAVRRSLALILAGLSAGGAAVHLAAAPSHYAEIGDLASGFVVAAALQAAWIRWCLAGPSRRAAVAGIAINAAIVAVWVWTRTIGLPVGPFAGGPEPIGYPDAASVGFELLLIAGLAVRLLDLDVVLARHAVVREMAAVGVVPVIGLVLVLASLAALAIATGRDHGFDPGHVSATHVAP
jgi:hypothetical protein